MKLLETQKELNNMLENWITYDLSNKQRAAIERALVEVNITIDNGDEDNL